MSIISRALPGLFGGVSQQIPALRHPTQCEAQNNAEATLLDGLSKRPALKFLSRLLNTDGSAFNGIADALTPGDVAIQELDYGNNTKYMLVMSNGKLGVYDLTTGNLLTCTFPDGAGYLLCASPSQNLICTTVADYSFIVNTTVKVLATASSATVNPPNVCYVAVKLAVASCTYTVTVDSVSYTYTATSTPTTQIIADALVTGLASALGSGYTVTRIPNTNVIKTVRTSLAASTAVITDGFGGLAMVNVVNGVARYSDLPNRFETGYTLTINGTADTFSKPYYVLWDGAKYVETKKPGIVDTLDKSTMPWLLIRNSDGTFTFKQNTGWGLRLIGDDATNPVPSFVGQTLRDVFFHRNRLGFLASDNVTLSKAGSYFDYWAGTATTVLDTDPIDLSASDPLAPTLEWAVPFNNELLAFSAKGQFLLTGGDILSPKTAKLVRTTAFEVDVLTRPQPLGNRVTYASRRGEYAAISLYQVATDVAVNDVDDITEHVQRYVPVSPIQIAPSPANKQIAVVSYPAFNTIYFFKYEEEANSGSVQRAAKMTQRSWSRFDLATPDISASTSILQVFWIERKLLMLNRYSHPGDTIAGGFRYCLEYVDFTYDDQDDGIGFGVKLDRLAPITGLTYSSSLDQTVGTMPYVDTGSLTIVGSTPQGDAVPLVLLGTVPNFTSYTTQVVLKGDQTARSNIYVGRKFSLFYQFTEINFQDQDGTPVMSSRLKLREMWVNYQSAGAFSAKVAPNNQPDTQYVYPFMGRQVGEVLGDPAVDDGDFQIPINDWSKGVAITLESDSYYPVTFPYAEWVGEYLPRAQR